MIVTRAVRTVASSCNASYELSPDTEARAVSPHEVWPEPVWFVLAVEQHDQPRAFDRTHLGTAGRSAAGRVGSWAVVRAGRAS